MAIELATATGPSDPGPGTYVLILHLPGDEVLQVGSLGRYPFPAGYYAYVGSALGSGGLAARLRHHLAPAARPHWHIDYLRRSARIEAIWLARHSLRHEHEWACLLACLPGARVVVPRFGASDCRCPAHLFYLPEPPSLEAFRAHATSE